ncbi:hypothetical protein P7K49_033987 [Saguinus oedipus]|uniref:Uncharacterized protein n=1 Tax=Saguinus oedipus TaxID=9490 RepID=A0ABQ9TUA8_SAGOE|nr:hypothetical protein P7K49_033987 [Saguinus oedipus]
MGMEKTKQSPLAQARRFSGLHEWESPEFVAWDGQMQTQTVSPGSHNGSALLHAFYTSGLPQSF